MKNNLLLLTATLLLLIAQTTLAQNIPSYVPKDGLIGWWPFNGNANDGSANNNNGTISGATLIADRFGNSNSAYYYDGINDYIEIPNISAYNNQLYTISYWTKFSTPSTPGSGGFDVNPALISKLSASTSVTYDNWVFYEANGTPGFAYGSAGYGSSNSLFNDNNWHNIICTVDSDSVRFYYDGVQTSAVLKGPNLTFNSQPIKIGRSIATYWKAFNGIIDDIAIYNRALSEQEIKNLYTGNICYQSVSVTDTLFINSTITSFNPITYENTIKIYPNPSQGQLTIDFGNINTLSGYQMKVINPVGQQIFQSNITQRISNISLSSFSAKGVYFVQLIDSKGEVRENRKIVIQ
ncbi:MAG: T9SS type A sorting domain-containing protein [Bacteroidetes bacterium]|nr:T9SS type A sorting domain-containing protein [Bacteroidota bacterium]